MEVPREQRLERMKCWRQILICSKFCGLAEQIGVTESFFVLDWARSTTRVMAGSTVDAKWVPTVACGCPMLAGAFAAPVLALAHYCFVAVALTLETPPDFTMRINRDNWVRESGTEENSASFDRSVPGASGFDHDFCVTNVEGSVRENAKY